MTAREAADRWLELRDAFARIPDLEIWVPEPDADHAVVRQGRAVLLLVTPAFLGRPESERAELRGHPAAPLILVGESPAELSTALLSAQGVEQHWPTPGSVSPRQLELALARTTTAEQGRLNFEIRHVLDIAASLNAERDPDRLLARILESMRQLTGADAGSLYVVEDQGAGRRALRFRVAQNDTLGIDDLPSGLLPIDATSIVGYVVETRRALNLADVDHLPPGLPVVFNKSYDLRAGYRTVSMLTVPLQAADGELLGAVQLINRKRDPGVRLGNLASVPQQVLPFSERDEQLAGSLAGAASIALVNARLTAEIRRLFDGFVRAAVFAIDSRDPCTSGHSLRVSRLSVALAGAAGRDARFEGALPLSEPRIRRLEYAALLHDFGKIGVSEDVLLKAKRLYPWEMAQLEARCDIVALSHEVEFLRRATRGELDPQVAERNIRAWRDEMEGALGRLRRANEPDPVTGELREFLNTLAARNWRDREGRYHPFLTPREHECLTVPYGSLTHGERMAIQEHVVHTGRFLEQIPWGRELDGLSTIAARHHEKLDGSGYPDGLRGDQIPLESRIITVADIYDALTAADRPYKASLPHVAARDILWSEADRGRLDPALVEIFVEQNLHGVLYEA
jgi:HD-GYP domain-containing protein (c-di-GMP phosphodiesterase class II)